MSLKKAIAIAAAGFLACVAPVGAALAAPASPNVSAAAAVVIDGDSGQVLWGRNLHQRRAMASTTKIMTALLAVESGRLDEVVTISKRASSVGEASIYLKEGEKLTLRELTYGVLLASGNDASTAVAEFLGGTEAGFVELMNRRAEELGLKNTHFSNPHGLPSKEHYSSAYDLSVLLRTASQLPEWNEIALTQAKKITGEGKPDGRLVKNHNKLLGAFPGAMGGKTGYTFAAGRCFVGSAKKGNRTAIMTVLGAPSLWEDSSTLLRYGLDNFENLMIARKGEVVGTVPIQDGNSRVVEVVTPHDVSISLPKGSVDKAQIQQVWQLPDAIAAPVNENQAVGKLIVRKSDTVLATVPLVAAQAVPIASLSWDHFSAWFVPGLMMASVVSLFRLQGARRRRAVSKKRGPRKPTKPTKAVTPYRRNGTGRLYRAG